MQVNRLQLNTIRSYKGKGTSCTTSGTNCNNYTKNNLQHHETLTFYKGFIANEDIVQNTLHSQKLSPFSFYDLPKSYCGSNFNVYILNAKQ